jgi:Holliday junction resolvasome RuvABC endonuclease subunit
MIILGLDISVNNTGYNIFDTSKKSTKARVREIGLISKPSSRPYSDKLFSFMREIEMLLIKYKPDFIVREELIKNVRGISSKGAIISMGTFHKILEMYAWKYGIEVIDIPVREFKDILELEYTTHRRDFGTKKAFIEARRKEKKQKTIEKMKSLYKGVDFGDSDDIADSLVVTYAYAKDRKEW